MNDEVCGECGSEVITRQVESTGFADRAKSYDTYAYACSNRSCIYSNPREISIAGFTVTRAEWEAQNQG